MSLAIAAAAAFLVGAEAAPESAGSGAPSPWVEMTRQDLTAMRDLLAANHPGAVDPERAYFADWLTNGYQAAWQQAGDASNFEEYRRALRFYATGFRDSHTNLDFILFSQSLWPGFIVKPAADGKLRVTFAEDGGPETGAELLSCDGMSAKDQMEKMVLPYFGNSDVPHVGADQAYRLFLRGTNDPWAQKSCLFRTSSGDRRIDLQWRAIPSDYSQKLAVGPADKPDMGVRKVGGVWFITVPTFSAGSPEEVAALDRLVDLISGQAAEIRAGDPIVIDVRGNGGGNSMWAGKIGVALWGKELVSWVAAPFDWTIDWRASPANLERVRDRVAWAKANGQSPDDDEKLVIAMEAAIAAKQPYVRVPSPGKPRAPAPPPNPVKGKVYLLTDGGCGSSCLDFADLVLRMPNVTHIGSATHADAAYIDVGRSEPLPSGLARLQWSLKVYRNRVRDHNEYYSPAIEMPTASLTQEDIAKRVLAL